MFCTKCGTRNDDNATTCIQCGNVLRPPAFGSAIPPAQTPPPDQPPPPPQAPIAQAYSSTPRPPMPSAYPAAPVLNIPNYLVQAILVTVFCGCNVLSLPFGIIAIVFASQVNGKAAIGDIQGAMSASKSAKMFCWIAFGIGIGFVLIYILLMMFGIATGILGGIHH